MMISSTAANAAPQQFNDFQGANAAAAAPTNENAATMNQQQQPANNQMAQQQQASMWDNGGQQRQKQQMSCLYTKQKTQKRKKWHDGRLVIHSMGASLFDAHPPPGSGDPKLDECCLTRAQCDALIRQMESRVETDKFLIQVEGPWTAAPTTAMAKPNALVSQGMKKVITRKFRKPGAYVPPPQQQAPPPAMRKRQRQPLQPGELQRRYYGDAAPQQQSLPPPGAAAAPPAWNQGLQQQQQRPPQMHGNQPNGGRPGNFQRMNGAPPQQQQPVQNQVPMRYDSRSPQPPQFQRGQEQPSPFQHARPNTAPPQQQQGQPYVPTNGYSNGVARQQHNTPPTAPPYQQPTLQQQQQQQQHAQVQPPPTNSTAPQQQGQRPDSFVQNQFNPNQFFGEDEELSQEESGDDDGGIGWNVQQAAPRNQSPLPSTSAVLGQDRKTNANRQAGPSPKPPVSTGQFVSQGQSTRPQADSRTNTNESNGNSAALSTNELLKLFGATPSPVAAAPATAAPATAAEPKVVESQASTAKQQGSSNFEFVLPPAEASDSSSDEESDDEETK